MKYFMIVMLASVLGFSSIAYCQEYDAKSAATNKYEAEKMQSDSSREEKKDSNILVVYYSRTGNTKHVAEDIAGRLDAHIERIIDKKKRGGIKGYVVAGKDAARKNTTEIEQIKKDPSKYDLVIIGTPIWAWNMTPAIRTYITNYKDKFKKVAYFTTAGGTKPDKIIGYMEELSGKKAIASVGVFEKDIKKKKDRYEEKLSGFVSALQK